MSFWEIIPLFNKNKIGFLTKKLLLLCSLLFLYTIPLTFFSWYNTSEGQNTFIFYAHLVPLILCGIIISLLIKNYKTLETECYSLNPSEIKSKYEKTGLSEAFSLELKNKLEHLMENEKLFLKHELKLDDIAELLDISRHHASQVINENFNMSFYEYVNSYRIEEAKDILCSSFQNSSTSISDIAYECGFNNRVSFYKAFKKVTHITPKEFIQKAA